METGLHRGAQRGEAVDGPGIGLGLLAAGLFHIAERLGVAAVIEAAQRFIVQHGIGLVRADVLQAIARGLDGHEAAIQFDGGVAAAALHVVRTRADFI